MTDRIKALEDALRPFALVAGEMFARNWNRGDVAILLERDGEEVSLTFDDFLAARAALAASSAAKLNECASDGCGNVAAIHFIRGNVGSYYCMECYLRVQKQVLPTIAALRATEGGDA